MVQELIERLAQQLQSRGLAYMLIGGQAVLLYGEPRLTKDIDVTLGAGTEKLPVVLELAYTLGLKVLVDSPESFVKQTMVLPCLEARSGIRIDFILSNTPYEQQALKRARPVKLGGTEIYFTTPEDLIIHKIIAGRPRDLEDVKHILLKNRDLDHAYIRDWLGRFTTELGQSYLTRFDQVLRENQ